MARPWLWRPPWYRDFVLTSLPHGSTGAEIGVFRGDFSERILRVAAPRQLFLVDPWKRSEEVASHIWGRETAQEKLDSMHAAVRARFAARPEVRVERLTSLEFAARLPNQSLDWVYLDGDHREEAVFQDLEAFWPKLRPGGVLAGDDYHRPRAWFSDGVTKGTRRFSAAHRLTLRTPGRHQFLLSRGADG